MFGYLMSYIRAYNVSHLLVTDKLGEILSCHDELFVLVDSIMLLVIAIKTLHTTTAATVVD